MTTVAEVLTWPKGAEVRDLYVRVTGAWEYKEFDSPKGKWGYLPLSVKDDSSQEYLRVEWRNPKTTDPEAIKGKRIVLSAYNGKGCNVDVYQEKHRIKVSGGCLRSDDGVEMAGRQAEQAIKDSAAMAQQTAWQAAPAPSGKPTLTELQNVGERVVEKWTEFLGYGSPADIPDVVLAAVLERAGGPSVGLAKGDCINDWPETQPGAQESDPVSAPPAEDEPPPPDDDEIPF